LASRRLLIGLTQAILALFLFAGICQLSGANSSAWTAAMADAAPARPLALGSVSERPHLRSELSVEDALPISDVDRFSILWAETDGDPDCDGVMATLASLEGPIGHAPIGVEIDCATAREQAAAYGATGPPRANV
jgi:hypothetical protein